MNLRFNKRGIIYCDTDMKAREQVELPGGWVWLFPRIEIQGQLNLRSNLYGNTKGISHAL